MAHLILVWSHSSSRKFAFIFLYIDTGMRFERVRDNGSFVRKLPGANRSSRDGVDSGASAWQQVLDFSVQSRLERLQTSLLQPVE